MVEHAAENRGVGGPIPPLPTRRGAVLVSTGINGGSGDDLISAGDGNDTIDGGADTDTIDGGAGIDSAINGENVTNVP